MTRLALLLALTLTLAGCADGPSGAHYLRTRQTAWGRIDYYRQADGSVGRLFFPSGSGSGRVRWLAEWEYPE